ncbi:transposase family protein [Neiella marina]|uniref:Transposase family protein n=1 Tax=Neiella holothuriorum TaxID=2870530 RepID=A0ABS7EF24_9GAMM|nr:Mu transposase C-terminal domain-containing protein [Neiella holothuriorum]MBW8190952.1 transposase family protein [Neiella holothuriorum]
MGDGSMFGFIDEMEASEQQFDAQPELTSNDIAPPPQLTEPAFDSVSPSLQQEAMRRQKIIQFVAKRLEGGWTEKNIKPVLELIEEQLEVSPPSWRTLVNWKKLYFESGKSVDSLVPKHRSKGCRQMVRDSQWLVDEAIEKKYLTKERVSIAATYRYYKSRVIIENRSIVEGKVKPLSQRAFYQRVNSLPPYDVAVARFGKRYADREFRTVGQQIPATKPMEYVEIDHTPVPVILIDDELDVSLGRPYLTMLYDRFSKCIVGLSVNFREPSYDSVRKALLNTLLDKSWLRKKYPSIKNEWPCCGKIDYLIVDNGAEFWSASLEESLKPLVTDIHYSQAAKPWRKTGIEKLFDQLNKGLINEMPGKTFTNPTQLEDYDPKKESVIRISTFMELVHKWVVDHYHMSPDARGRGIPYHSWKSSEWPPITYSRQDADRLRVELGVLSTRTVRQNGINIHGLRYQSDELNNYRKYTPASNGYIEVKTKTDPSDIGAIYVYLEQEERYIKVPAVDVTGYTKGLSLFEHKVIQKVRRTNTQALVDEESLADTQLYLEQRLQQETDRLAQLQQKKTSRIKTGHTSKLAKIRDVGSDGPTTIISKPMNKTVVPREELSSLSDDDLGDIEGY